MADVAVCLLGPFQLTLDGRPVTGFKSDRVRALLAYLAVEYDRPQPRGRLAGLLWPDLSERVATQYLRDVLANLRQIMGDRVTASQGLPLCLLVSRDAVQLNLAAVRVDVHEMLGRLHPRPGYSQPASGTAGLAPADLADIEAAVALYRGPFLEGFSFAASVDFEEWAIVVRERLRLQVLTGLRHLVAAHSAAGSVESALAAATRSLEIEPWDEETQRQAMRLLAQVGWPGRAMAQYEACRAGLTREFGVQPSRETTALFESIRRGEVAPAESREQDPLRPPPGLSEWPQPAAGASSPRQAPPFNAFVARDAEMQWLARHLQAALAGEGRVLLVTGEAGSGKTRLLSEFRRRVLAEHADVLIAEGRCNSAAGAADAYLPFREIAAMLTADVEAQRAAGAVMPVQAERLWAALPDSAEMLVQHAPDLVHRLILGPPLVARVQAFALPWQSGWPQRLVSLAESAPPAAASSEARLTRLGLNGQYAAWLQALSHRYPLLLTIDDLQWADNPTLDLLFHLGRRLAGVRVLMIAAYRADEFALTERSGGRRHPLELIANELVRVGGDIRLDLDRCEGQRFVEELLGSEPADLPPSFTAALYKRTGGHRLFTVDLLRALHERGSLVRDVNGPWILGESVDWEQLPARAEAVIAERLARLPAAWQELLAVASVQGEEFSAEVTARVLNVPLAEVRRLLAEGPYECRLVYPHRIVSSRDQGPPQARYRFQHDLYRQYLYCRLEPVMRAAAHQTVAVAMEALYGSRAAEVGYGEPAPEINVQLAWHFEQAGLPEKAVEYLLRAGQQAMRLSAYQEAVDRFERGLALLAALPASTERAKQEVALRVPLAASLTAARGWAAPERAMALAGLEPGGTQAGSPLRAVHVLTAQADVLRAQGEFARSIRVSEDALDQARAAGDRQSLMLTNYSLAMGHYFAGNMLDARHHFEESARMYFPSEDADLSGILGADPQASVLTWLAPTLWILGYPEQAVATAAGAIRRADELEQPMTLAIALSQRCTWHAFAGLPIDAENDIEFLCHLGREKGWPVIRVGCAVLEGWWLARSGQVVAGIKQMKAALESWRAAGMIAGLPIGTTAYAQLCLENGLVDEGLAAVEDMLAFCGRGIGRPVEAELRRLRGEFVPKDAETCFTQALDIAREQGARSWELRAAMSLTRLEMRQDRSAEARALLAGVYRWFTEGFDSPDLAAARVLLGELGETL